MTVSALIIIIKIIIHHNTDHVYISNSIYITRAKIIDYIIALVGAFGLLRTSDLVLNTFFLYYKEKKFLLSLGLELIYSYVLVDISLK